MYTVTYRLYIYTEKRIKWSTHTHTQSILKGESHRVQLGIENEKIHKIFSCLTVVVKLYIFVHFTVCASVICIIDIKHIKCVWMLWLNRVISFFGFHCSEYIVHVWIYIYIYCVWTSKWTNFWWKNFESCMKTSGCKPNDHTTQSSMIVWVFHFLQFTFFSGDFCHCSTDKNDCDKIDTVENENDLRRCFSFSISLLALTRRVFSVLVHMLQPIFMQNRAHFTGFWFFCSHQVFASFSNKMFDADAGSHIHRSMFSCFFSLCCYTSLYPCTVFRLISTL